MDFETLSIKNSICFFISFVGEKDIQVTEDESSKFHMNDNCSSKIHESEGDTCSDTCGLTVERCDSFTSADEPIAEPKSGSSTLTSSSDWSTLTCVPNDSKSKDQLRSLSNTDPSWNSANVECSETDGAVVNDPGIVGSDTDMVSEGTSDLLKPPAPFIECPITSPLIVDTMRIACPVPMIQTNAPSNQKKGCSFSTFGYGPDGKLEPVPHTGPESAKDITQTEIDSQSTSSSETPSTHRVRLTTFQKNKVNVAQNGTVPDICNDTMNYETLPHKNRRRRIGSSGSSSLTSFSETDDSGSHTSVERDANQKNHLRTPDLLSPFHSRMGSNTSSGVSSVSQDSVSSVARIQAKQGGLVSKLVSSFQNSSLESTTLPAIGPKPSIGHISKLGHSNWHSACSNASSGLTGSISDSFSASDAENVDVCQTKITDRSKQPSPLNRMDRGGSSGSYNSQESSLSSLQNSGIREYDSSVGEREYSSRECTSQESDISSLDFTPVGSTPKTRNHQRGLKAEKKNVSFEKSGKNS